MFQGHTSYVNHDLPKSAELDRECTDLKNASSFRKKNYVAMI